MDHPPTVNVHVLWPASQWWAIMAAVVVGFGAAALGGWMQRNATLTALRLQHQIAAGARFLGAVGEFQFAYRTRWT